jgi:DNA-directed RNA polymerases I and III subunit RPAC2
MSDSDFLTTQKIQLLNSTEDARSITVSIENEDHTIGNLLRWILLKDERVEFASYAIPHPSDNRIHVRVQTLNDSAVLVLDDAFSRLIELAKFLEKSWTDAVVKY